MMTPSIELNHGMLARGSMLVILFLWFASTGSAQRPAGPDSLVPGPTVGTTGYPVSPFLDTILTIRTRLGSFTPQARAEAISARIGKVADDPFYQADSIRVDSNENAYDVVYGETILLTVTNADARAAEEGPRILAEQYASRIAVSIDEHRNRTGWRELVKEILLALLVIGVLVGIIVLVSRLFVRSASWLTAQKGGMIRGLRIRNYEFLTADRSLGALLLLNTAAKWLVVLLAVYLAFPILFGIFPWTRGLADTLLGYVLTPLKHIATSVWHYIPNLITIVVIVWIFRYVLKGLAFLRNEIERGVLTMPGFYPDWAAPTYQLLRVVIYAFMLVVIFPYLPGSDSPVFQGVTVFLGALFTFGSAGSLSNIIAGLVLTYMRAFRVGDRVRIGDVTGDIIERTLLVTRVRTIKNEMISIPNSTVMSNHTTNFSSDAPDKGLIVHTTVTIGYDAPWRQVHKLLIEAASGTDMIEQEPEPFVLQTSLDDFYVSYQINAYTKQPNKQATIYSQLHQNIQDRFNEAGVEITSPHFRALRDGNLVTIPADHLPKDYVTPSFRVQRTEAPRKPD